MSAKAIQASPADIAFYHSEFHRDAAEVMDGDADCLNKSEETVTETMPLPSTSIPDEDSELRNHTSFNNHLEHCEHIICMKSAIPLSKLKGLHDEMDIPEIIEFRCESCASCPTCKMSA